MRLDAAVHQPPAAASVQTASSGERRKARALPIRAGSLRMSIPTSLIGLVGFPYIRRNRAGPDSLQDNRPDEAVTADAVGFAILRQLVGLVNRQLNGAISHVRIVVPFGRRTLRIRYGHLITPPTNQYTPASLICQYVQHIQIYMCNIVQYPILTIYVLRSILKPETNESPAAERQGMKGSKYNGEYELKSSKSSSILKA